MRQRRPTPAYLERTRSMYLSFATVIIALGSWFILSPQWFYGPSWSYFHRYIPTNGLGLGLCLVLLAGLQILAIRRAMPATVLAILLFLSAFVFWVAGVILGAEGLMGHQGLQEAPLMIVIAIHKGAHSAHLWARYRKADPK